MVRQIGWTHNALILERKFYIRMTRKYAWSNKKVLCI